VEQIDYDELYELEKKK